MIDFASLEKSFLSAPGDDLVVKLILQMQSVPQFAKIFGAPSGPNSSWANYPRMDWPVRMLPAMNVFESNVESKSSDNGYLTGTIQIQVIWPSEFRRDDLARVPAQFKGVLENFFSSRYVRTMLDELYWHQRPAKVYGLNELGKTLTWSPSVEGVNDGDLTPITILDVQYRIDLRAWERALEFMGRTTADPFEVSLANLTELLGEIDGVNDAVETVVTVDVDFTLNGG